MSENNRTIAWGYFQNSGRRADCSNMFAEAQPHLTETKEATIQLRVGVFPESGHLEPATLRESCIQMSTKQAYELAQSIRRGITQAIEMQTVGCSVMGMLLFIEPDFIVLLNNLNYLHVSVDSFPALEALSADQRMDFQVLPDRSGFEWPEHGIRVTLAEMIQKATSIDTSADHREEPK